MAKISVVLQWQVWVSKDWQTCWSQGLLTLPWGAPCRRI